MVKIEKLKRINFIQFINSLYSYNKVKVTTGFLIMIFLGLTQGIGLLILIPFLSIIGIFNNQESQHKLVDFVHQAFQAIGLPLTLVNALLIYCMIILVHALLQRYQQILNLQIEKGFVRYVRGNLYESLTYAKWSFLLHQKLSDITAILTTEMQRIGSGAHFLLQFVSTGILAIVFTAVALILSVELTLLSLFIALIFSIMLWSKNQKVTQSGKSLQLLRQQLFSSIIEQIGGIKVAKSYNAEAPHVKKFQTINNHIEYEFLKFAKIRANNQIFLQIGSACALSLFVYLAVEVVKMPVGELLLFILIFSRLIPKFSKLQQSLHQILNMLPAFETVLKLQHKTNHSQESDLVAKQVNFLFHSYIQLKNVTYNYNNHVKALDNINIRIPALKITGIIGQSGAGKSTLADVIMGLLPPKSGSVLIDGKYQIAHNLKSWRQIISYVPQETILFHDTIRANLLWAKPDSTDNRLHEVLKMAACDDFVFKLHQGLDTVIGDRGVRLSGGERQRIALARALLRNPEILILDEATSSLDTKNEQHIQAAIEQLHGQLTIIIIAHRMSTIRNADYIAVLDHGQIVEYGSWTELAALRNGTFFQLVSADSYQGQHLQSKQQAVINN